MYDESYHDLYVSYFEDLKSVQLTPLIGYINSCLDAYFINGSEWLKGFFPIKPILPIYYPVIPYMVEYQHILSHLNSLRGILRVKNDTKIVKPASWHALINKANLVTKTVTRKSYLDYILISPVTNSAGGISIDFWVKLASVLANSRCVVINSPSQYWDSFKALNNTYLTHYEAHLVLPAIESSIAYIGAGNGLSNMAKIFCKSRQVVIINALDGESVARKGLASNLPTKNQYYQYSEEAISSQMLIMYSDNSLCEQYIDQICEFLKSKI